MSIENTLYTRLTEVARVGKTIGRDEVACLLGLDPSNLSDRQALIRVLNDISYQENAAGRPLLSAVVVLPEIGYPGKAFFLLARELGLNHFGDDRSFYYYELKRVHQYWRESQPIPAIFPFKAEVDRHTILAVR